MKNHDLSWLMVATVLAALLVGSGSTLANTQVNAITQIGKTISVNSPIDYQGQKPSYIVDAPTDITATLTQAEQQFGVQESHVLWMNQNFTLPRIQTLLDRVKAGGLKWLRIDVEWIHVEPSPGHYNSAYLSRLDDVLALMRERDIEPVAILQTAPDWAKTKRPGCWEAEGNPDRREWAIPPDDPANYAAVAGYLARRFLGRIKVWEIWNEPNICAFWNSPEGPDATRYTDLLKAAYPVIKAVDSNITVLGGALSGNDLAYLSGMYDAGAGPHFDALSVHPYNPGRPPEWIVPGQEQYSFAAVPIVKDVMANRGDAGKSIWITEMGWTTRAYPWTSAVDDATRSEYFRRAVQMMRGWPYVKVFIAYYLDNNGEPADGYELWEDEQPTESWNAYTGEVAGMPYNDVPLDNPFFSYIRDLAARGIVDPVQGREFQPFQSITRATLARWVVRARGWSFDLTGAPHFSDVPPDHPDYQYVETAYNHGVLSGYSPADCPGRTAACFKPDSNLTRGQMSKLIVNAMGWPYDTSGGPHFLDVRDVPGFAFYNHIETIYNRGLVSGYTVPGGFEFRWGNDLTRGQLSKVLAHAIQVSESCHQWTGPNQMALQEAVNRFACVEMQYGVWETQEQISMPAGHRLLGKGIGNTTLKAKAPWIGNSRGAPPGEANKSEAVVHNNGQSGVMLTGFTIDAAYLSTFGAAAHGSSDIMTVDSVRVVNAKCDGIAIAGPGMVVRNSIVENNGAPCQAVVLPGYPGGVPGSGIYVTKADPDSNSQADAAYAPLIVGNVIQGNDGPGLDVDRVWGGIFRGNIVRNNAGWAAVSIYAASHWLIEDNEIYHPVLATPGHPNHPGCNGGPLGDHSAALSLCQDTGVPDQVVTHNIVRRNRGIAGWYGLRSVGNDQVSSSWVPRLNIYQENDVHGSVVGCADDLLPGQIPESANTWSGNNCDGTPDSFPLYFDTPCPSALRRSMVEAWRIGNADSSVVDRYIGDFDRPGSFNYRRAGGDFHQGLRLAAGVVIAISFDISGTAWEDYPLSTIVRSGNYGMFETLEEFEAPNPGACRLIVP